MPNAAPPDRRSLVFGLLAIAAVTLWRVGLLPFYSGDLFVDDAQYWLWSRELDWGYYSKPPLIAWIIAGATAIGGDAPFWIRLPMPLIHGATALAILWSGRALWGDRIGALAGVFFVAAPAAAVGSLVLSTDTPMLLCYALALRAYLGLLRGGGFGWAVLLGAAIGLGLLAKYAMIYFVVGAAVAALILPAARGARAGPLVLAGGLALAIVAPNLVWNLRNDLATLQHTASNADLGGGPQVDLAALLAFWAAQFAVSGPILFAAYLARVFRPADFPARYLAALSVPVFAIVSVQALLSGANANWAAAGHVGAILLGAAVLAERRTLLALGLGLNLAVALALPLAATQARTLSFGGEKVFARYLGRAEVSRVAAEIAAAEGLGTLVSGDRSILADMFYTLRDAGLALHAAPVEGFPPHHYAQRHALPPGSGEVLYVSRAAGPPDCVPGAPAPRLVARRDIVEGRSDKPLSAWRVARDCWHGAAAD